MVKGILYMMIMNHLSYCTQNVAQNDLVVESHTFVAAILIVFSVYLKSVLITMTQMKLHGSKLQKIILKVCRWVRMSR